MDAISAVGNNQTSSVSTSARNNATVDYDAFLQLLVAQLNNQDPTEPLDNAQLMSQLASFSSVEQQIQTNDKLDQLITGNLLGDATGLIGKSILSADGETEGTVVSVILASDGVFAELKDGSKVLISAGTKISDASGEEVSGSTNAFGLF